MANYQKAIVKSSNTQSNKLKSPVKNNTNTVLRYKYEYGNFENEKLLHKLFLTTRQTTTKIRNAFDNNKWTDIEFSKAQIPKIIQSAGSIGSWLGNLLKKALTNIAISWARDNLPGLVSNLTWNAIEKGLIQK